MKIQNGILALGMVLGLVGCNGTQSSSNVLKTDIDQAITYLSSSSTEYDVMSLLGTPQSISDGNYIYTSSTGIVYSITISIDPTFESLWDAKSMTNSVGHAYSYSDLQSYVDQIRIAISNQGGDIYDPSSWGGTGNTGVAESYIEQIEAFKTAQGSNLSHVVSINGVAL